MQNGIQPFFDRPEFPVAQVSGKVVPTHHSGSRELRGSGRFLRPGELQSVQRSDVPAAEPDDEPAPGIARTEPTDRLSVALGTVIGFAGLAVLWASFAGRL